MDMKAGDGETEVGVMFTSMSGTLSTAGDVVDFSSVSDTRVTLKR